MTYQWSDLVGSLVGGKYRLTEYLGDVGDNGVFATDGAAIVRLAPGATADDLFDRWSASARLAHPSLIRIIDSGRAELGGSEFVYTATERPDDSLAEAVRARALTAEEARDVVKSVLSALAYLHQQGFVYGSVDPDNIVAVGERIKLGPWTIRHGDQAAMADDMFSAGQTMVEVLTQQRPGSDVQADVANLPAPFGHLARAALQRRITAGEALQVLEGRQVASAQPPVRVRLPKTALIGAMAGVLVLLLGVRAYKNGTPAQNPVPVVSQAPEQAVRERSIPPVTTAAVAPQGNWVIVAAIYKDYDLAAKRAEAIGRRWQSWQLEVFPPEGQGKRRYMVLLHRADSRKEAERLLARARSQGMPSDVYVTKLTR